MKDLFIWEIANDTLQENVLAKEGSLKTQEQKMYHAEAFETAMRNHHKALGILDIAGLRMSTYCRQKISKCETNTPKPWNELSLDATPHTHLTSS